ncbi:MAG TPA: VOC family protein [Terriglobales bacterium]|jgi:catechol 2,3-dioxygenase-like lactoylglutathione lyase family enzyme|nr:VOC family protein [Terriglobales bacterium]
MNPLANRFDHIVLTVNDIDTTSKFYERVLGFEKEVFPGSDGTLRYALRFGKNKINLQDRATGVVNKAQSPTFGSGDFCLIAAVPLEQLLAHLRAENVLIEAGPVKRRGAAGQTRSVYFRHPDAIWSKFRTI